jgi:P27 family predicted phage terminase small subunit
MRGRKPKPSFLKLVHGSRKPIRKNEPKPKGDLLHAPDWLDGKQREEWTYAIANTPAGMLKRIDRAPLVAYVVHACAFREATEQLNKTPLLVRGWRKNSPVQNPLIRVRARESLLMLKACAELGFSPASRTRVEASPDPRLDDDWSELLD